MKLKPRFREHCHLTHFCMQTRFPCAFNIIQHHSTQISSPLSSIFKLDSAIIAIRASNGQTVSHARFEQMAPVQKGEMSPDQSSPVPCSWLRRFWYTVACCWEMLRTCPSDYRSKHAYLLWCFMFVGSIEIIYGIIWGCLNICTIPWLIIMFPDWIAIWIHLG